MWSERDSPGMHIRVPKIMRRSSPGGEHKPQGRPTPIYTELITGRALGRIALPTTWSGISNVQVKAKKLTKCLDRTQGHCLLATDLSTVEAKGTVQADCVYCDPCDNPKHWPTHSLTQFRDPASCYRMCPEVVYLTISTSYGTAALHSYSRYRRLPTDLVDG